MKWRQYNVIIVLAELCSQLHATHRCSSEYKEGLGFRVWPTLAHSRDIEVGKGAYGCRSSCTNDPQNTHPCTNDPQNIHSCKLCTLDETEMSMSSYKTKECLHILATSGIIHAIQNETPILHCCCAASYYNIIHNLCNHTTRSSAMVAIRVPCS